MRNLSKGGHQHVCKYEEPWLGSGSIAPLTRTPLWNNARYLFYLQRLIMQKRFVNFLFCLVSRVSVTIIPDSNNHLVYMRNIDCIFFTHVLFNILWLSSSISAFYITMTRYSFSYIKLRSKICVRKGRLEIMAVRFSKHYVNNWWRAWYIIEWLLLSAAFCSFRYVFNGLIEL